jgi:hypothetical protein
MGWIFAGRRSGPLENMEERNIYLIIDCKNKNEYLELLAEFDKRGMLLQENALGENIKYLIIDVGSGFVYGRLHWFLKMKYFGDNPVFRKEYKYCNANDILKLLKMKIAFTEILAKLKLQ